MNNDEMAEELAGFNMAHTRIHSRADELISCLEGEIAKRDARIMGLESQYQRDVCGLNNEGDPIGGEPAGWYANDNARLRAELAALKAQDTVGEVVGWYRLDRPYEMTSYPSVCATWHKLGAPVAPLYAAPVQQDQAFCEYCGGNDEEPQDHCMDCTRPVQQVSVPQCVLDWFEAKQAHVTAVDAYNARLAFVREHMPFGTSVDPEYQIMEAADRKARSLVGPMFSGLRDLAAAPASPAAPAADAGASLIEWTKDAVEWGGALNYAAWEFVNECPEKSALLFNNTKGPLRAAIMKYAEIVAAHRAKGVV